MKTNPQPPNGRANSLLSFLLGFAALLSLAALAYWAGREYRNSTQWQIHTDQVISEIRELSKNVETAESAQRGFILTQQLEFIESYQNAKVAITASEKNLSEMVSDNPLQTSRLQGASSKLSEKLAFLDSGVSLVKSGQIRQAQEMIKAGRGRVLMDEIVAALTQLESEESSLLKTRSAKSEHDFQLASLLFFLGLLTGLGFLVYSNFTLHREISLRAKTETELQTATRKALEASNLKSSFLANMSHEIRTPLNGIIGMSKLLEQTELNDRQVDYVHTIKTSSNTLLALINEILDISKIESGKLQLEEANFELGSLIKSTLSIVEFSAKSKGIQMVAEIASDVPEFFVGDPLRLRQVLLNLLNNAIKFSEKGAIRLRVTRKLEAESRTTLLFEVIDQGVGLDVDAKDKIFDTFSQGDDSTSRRYGGSGLGLAISKQIVEMMQGKIDVESIKGVGSRFFFDVSLKTAKYDDSVRPVSFDKMALKNLRGYVLIAEDNKVNQKVVTEMIGLLGCRCKVVENGAEAIEALKREDFNLILMDGQMPTMDGYEATRLIRNGKSGEKNKLIPILATTANAIKGDIERCLEAGMNDYISKPISYDDLAFKVEKWMTRGKHVIDETSIQKIQKLGEKTGKPLLQELIKLFMDDSAKALAEMRKLLAEKNFEQLSEIAHNQKSSAANLGALRLRELAERIERAKVDGNENHALLLIDSFDRELKLVIEDLGHRL